VADCREEGEVVKGLLDAYRQGLFPMADPRTGRISWYCPDPRAIFGLEPGAFHVPRSLRRRVRSRRFAIRTDSAFEAVMRGCAGPRPTQPDSWIDERIIAAYTALHRAGHAHSVEAWLADESGEALVGGVYGVSIGAAFFAESKFSRPDLGGTDASKVCLVHLVEHARRRGYQLMDVQFWNPHLDQFGCAKIPRGEYLERLARAVGHATQWLPFEPERVCR
jgi:leucyl/phenylalanyl-tRNA--protein transferase